MKEGWTYKKLGEVCELYQPKTISTKEMVPDGEFDVFGANGIIGKYDQYNHEHSEILMTCRGATCGNINISTPKSWINGNAMVVHIKDDTVLNRAFLVYALSFIDKKHIITGAAQPQITRQTLSPLTIAFPCLSEQLSIVSRLDAAFAHIDALKANAEKQLAEARQLFQAELAECMKPKEGWEEKRLGEVCEIFGRIGFRGYTRGDLVDTPEKGAITLSPSNIVDGEMNYNKCTYITWKKYEESPEIMIYPGDILLVKTASVGKTALVKSLPHKATINPQFVVMKKITIDNRYLSYYLKTEEAQHYIWSIAKGAAAQTVSQKNLAEMKIPVPDDTVQQSIVSRLDALSANIKKLEEVQRKTLAECDALKQAMLREVFE